MCPNEIGCDQRNHRVTRIRRRREHGQRCQQDGLPLSGGRQDGRRRKYGERVLQRGVFLDALPAPPCSARRGGSTCWSGWARAAFQRCPWPGTWPAGACSTTGEALLPAVLVDELERVGEHAGGARSGAGCGGAGAAPVAGEPPGGALGDLEEERLRVLALGGPVGAVVGDGHVRRVHEVLEEDGVIVGELVHRGQVREPGTRVRLEPRQLPLVGRVRVRQPHPHHALRIPHLVVARARAPRDLRALRQLWYLDALALAVELPAMVEALDLAVNELAFRQLG
uniref:Uncharacterized protein n=1 Tax=Arundo donax TaxID=35708 RepID=A0A0A9D5R2_ARUDO